MIRTYLFSGALALACAGAAASAQQISPAQPTSPRPATQPPTPTTIHQQSSTVVTGCLYRERQVRSGMPNATEGARERYILVAATGTGGAQKVTRYEVEDIPEARLSALVGKRVEVTGELDPDDGGPGGAVGTAGAATGDRRAARDDDDLPELEAASIREVAGTCPATPEPAPTAPPR